MVEKDCFAGFDEKALARIIAYYIRCLQKGEKHDGALLTIGSAFFRSPQDIDEIINRLLPKFLLRIISRKRILSSNEKKIVFPYLDLLTKGCCHSEALSEVAKAYSKDPVHLEGWLRNILLKAISELRPLSRKPFIFD